MRMIYSETLLDHFEQPRHVGQLPEGKDVGTGLAGSRESGGVLRMQIRVNDDNILIEARFQAYGPPALIATGSWLAEHMQGMALEAAEALMHQPIVRALSLPSASLHFAMLGVDALRAAIQDYKDKQKVYA